MSRIWFTGFEQNSLDIFEAVNLDASIDSVNQRSGDYCFEAGDDVGATSWGRIQLLVNQRVIYFRAYVKVSNAAIRATDTFMSFLAPNTADQVRFLINGEVTATMRAGYC